MYKAVGKHPNPLTPCICGTGYFYTLQFEVSWQKKRSMLLRSDVFAWTMINCGSTFKAFHIRKSGLFAIWTRRKTPNAYYGSYTYMPSALVADNGKRQTERGQESQHSQAAAGHLQQPQCLGAGKVRNVNKTLIAVMSPKRHLVITLSKRKLSILARLYKQHGYFTHAQETGSAVLKVCKCEMHSQL